MIVFAVVLCLILLFIGVPLFMVFGLGGLVILNLHTGFPINSIAVFFFDNINSWVLLAAPLFLLAGSLMVRGGMAKPLVDFLSCFVTHVSGGLAVAVIISSAVVGGLTGSLIADMAVVGMVMFPALIEAKYERGFSAGLLCAASPLAYLIPPSLSFILYGFLTQTSVAKLFIAGIIPGLLVAALLSIPVILISKKRKYPVIASITWKERKDLFIKAVPSLFIPVIILGGIYGGICTPTEAAVLAVVYTCLGGIFFYQLNLKNIWACLIETVEITSIVLLLLSSVLLMGKALMTIKIPVVLGEWVISSGVTPLQFLIYLNIAFIAIGIVMDAFGMMAMIPVIMPAVTMLGIDYIHLGVVYTVAAAIGGMTPPAAGSLYFASALFKVPTLETIRGILPFLLMYIIALFLLSLFPSISTWLPGTLMGG